MARLALFLTFLVGCGPSKSPDAKGTSADAPSEADAGPDAAAPDDSANDDTADAAWKPSCPGGAGCTCVDPTDCDVPLCLETAAGKRCSAYCGDGVCAPGWVCEGKTSGADPTYYCIAAGGLVCRPCQADADCEGAGHTGATCVDYGDAGGFCGLPCKSDDACPSGRVCRVVASVQGGAKSSQCVAPGPDATTLGTCGCSPYASARQLKTTCWEISGSGLDAKRCKGTRSCTAVGLGACELLVGDAAVCQQAQCLDPATLQPVADGKACDDGRVCTPNDACKSGACQGGPSICPCEPGIADCPKPSADDAANLCKGPPYCAKQPDGAAVPYLCAPNPGLTKVCDDSVDDPCSKNACAPLSGDCTLTAAERTTSICDLPGDACRLEVKADALPDNPPAPCDDGLGCTTSDLCDGGKCNATPADKDANCGCLTDADCVDDGDLCNGKPYCHKSGTSWTCAINPGTIVTCDSSGDAPCEYTACDKATGGCSKGDKALGVPCSDGVACTSGDICDGKGGCSAGAWTCCNSESDCLDPTSKHYADDGNLCNGVPFCNKQSGLCEPNPATVITCPTAADTVCSNTQCNPTTGTCAVVLADPASKTACDDGDPCTGGDACVGGGSCKGGTFVCPCTSDADCVAKDDGNLCNGTLYCDPTVNLCKANPATVVTCQTVDDGACTKTSCQPKTGACKAVDLPAKTTCDADGSYCTSGDQCDGKGGCLAGTAICVCEQDADCGVHEDGDLCNGTLYCDKSDPKAPVCRLNPKTVLSCPSVDDTACSRNRCQPKSGKCVVVAEVKGKACEDGEACTGPDGCDGVGGCKSGGSVCGCKGDGDCGIFDDGDVCNGGFVCENSGCSFDPKGLVCDDGNGCTEDGCDKAKGCVYLPNKATCDDGDACTGGDGCSGAVCLAGVATICDDGNACTSDSCNPGKGCGYVATPLNCSDGDACTVGDACQGGACLSGGVTTCDDGNSCSDDTCDSNKGCTSKYAPSSCDDGSNCTIGDGCLDGVCVAGQSAVFDRIYQKTTEIWRAKPLVGGGTILAGHAGKVPWRAESGPDGKLNWESKGTYGHYFSDVAVLVDGYAFSVAACCGAASLAISRTNTAGKELWFKSFAQGASGSATNVAALANGNLILAGTTSQGSDESMRVIMLTSGGDAIWSKVLQPFDQSQRSPFVATADGGFSATSSNGGSALLARYSSQGSLVTLVNVDSSKLDTLAALDLAPPGGWYAAGSKSIDNDDHNRDAWIVRFDDLGNVVWQSTVDSIPNTGEIFKAVVGLQDGGVVAVGCRHVGETGKQVPWAARLDPGGALAWQRSWEDTGDGCALSVQEDANGRIVVAGRRQLLGWVARISPYGDASCTQDSACGGKVADDCTDANFCTLDVCDTKLGCSHLNVADNTICPSGFCVNGVCKAGCPAGHEGVEIDVAGVMRTACTAIEPVWGNRADTPKGIFKSSEPVPGAGKVVVDEQTRLMWQQSAVSAGKTWQQATSYCDELNYAGHQDWRLPSSLEQEGLIDYGVASPGPAIDQIAFPGTQPTPYWSATLAAEKKSFAWYIGFDYGYAVYNDLGNAYQARCVRATSTLGVKGVRFVVSGEGDVVTDLRTSIQWQRKLVPSNLKTWANAVAYCADLEIAGHADWRLPFVRELSTIVDKAEFDPSIDSSIFPGTPSIDFWSGTARAGNASLVWRVNFRDGRMHPISVSTTVGVRCVRGN